MNIDAKFNITAYQWDWGTPVIFNLVPDQGLSIIGETVALTFESGIAEISALIDSDDFDFPFSLTKDEADNLFSNQVVNPQKIPYSMKRYKDGQYLETLFNANLIITRTVKLHESNGQEPTEGTS